MESRIISLYHIGGYCKNKNKRLSINILYLLFLISLCFCSVENPQSKNNKRNFSVFTFLAYNEKSSIVTTQVGSMNLTHTSPRAILLDNGKVIIVGRGAELFDSSTLNFSVIGNRTISRTYHTLTKLQDGRILISGGNLSTVEIYDSTTATFTNTGSMVQAIRYGHTGTLLSNGKVLVTGGSQATTTSSNLLSAELYDPTTGVFTSTGNLNFARRFHYATLLNDGTVLIVGGLDSQSQIVTTPEIYNPSTGVFTSISNSSCQTSTYQTSTLLSNKNIFLADNAYIPNIQIFNTSSNSCTTIQQSLRGISYFSTALLKDGRVLIIGGQTTKSYLRELSVFDPNSNTVSILGNMNQYRSSTLSIPLQDGRVLIFAGEPSTSFKIAEIYTP